jgi:catechol 2,3-dioxygenase-like lactoylglutathione lyase family enzyme
MLQHHLISRCIIRVIARMAVALSFSFCLLTPFLKAQSQPPPLAGIAHVAIRVHDLATARDFYAKLGFQEAFNLSKDGVVYESFIKISDRQFIELYPVTAKDPKAGFLHLCFEGDDLNAIYADYVSRGLVPTPVRKAGAGNLLFTMVGPENQNIEYTQYLPGSLHSNDKGKHLSEDRIADRMVSASLAMQDTAAAHNFYVDKLIFRAASADAMFLYLPGDSGQKIEIAPVTLGTRARIILNAISLSKASELLRRQQIPWSKAKNELSVTDPDGNIILIEAFTGDSPALALHSRSSSSSSMSGSSSFRLFP